MYNAYRQVLFLYHNFIHYVYNNIFIYNARYYTYSVYI